MVSVEYISSEYPLHWLVWTNDYKALEVELAKREVNNHKRVLLTNIEVNSKLLQVFYVSAFCPNFNLTFKNPPLINHETLKIQA